MQNHSPRTQKFSYYLSDLNDHHNMRTKFREGRDDEYVMFEIWFGGLRNCLQTNVNYQGEVLMGCLKCVVEPDVTEDDVRNVAPDFVNVRSYITDEGNGSVRLVIHQSNDSTTMSAEEYIEKAKQLKSVVLREEIFASQ